MNYKKKYLKYKKKYLKIKNIYGGEGEYGEISTEKDLETNLEILKEYEMKRKQNPETKDLSGINYLEYILKYTKNLPDACDFIEQIKNPSNTQFENFFSSILQGFYTVHAHGVISEEQFNDTEILPENVSLITIINSNEKCNLKIYKRAEELKYNILNFNNQGKEYDVDDTDTKLTLNIYTPGSNYHNMDLANVLTENSNISYKEKEYANRVVPGVFSMYNFLQLNKPLDPHTTLAKKQLIEMDALPVPIETTARTKYFEEKTYRKDDYKSAVIHLNNYFKNMSSILSNDIEHKKIKLSDIINELSENEGGILIVNSCREITGFNPEKESSALNISQTNIETVQKAVVAENSIMEFTKNEEFWHLLWIISLFNGNERNLNQPEIVHIDKWDEFSARIDTEKIDRANKLPCNIQ